MNYRMPTCMFGCPEIPGILKNECVINSVRECWKLDKLAKCFGVFLINFCVAIVKETTNILTSQNVSVTKATFLQHVLCFESLCKDKASCTIH